MSEKEIRVPLSMPPPPPPLLLLPNLIKSPMGASITSQRRHTEKRTSESNS
jgi:hypothetical protein